MRGKAMVTPVPGHERHPASGYLADDQRVAGTAERGLDGDFLGGVQELIEPGAADDTDAGQLGHDGSGDLRARR